MKILLLGCQGQVGWELQRSLAPLGEVIALIRHNTDGLCGDLNQPTALARTIKTLTPNVIVNAAAYTAVDQAESESDLAQAINAVGPSVLARETQKLGALLVHYSTDYVFDGSGAKPWREDDRTVPLNVYGQTKRAGERAIQESDCRHLIFRTSWVYASRGKNFIRTMLRLAAERDALQVIDDQYGAPTGAALIADVTAQALPLALRKPELEGLYHLAASGETTWHGYACRVIEQARQAGWPVKIAEQDVWPIATDAFPVVAQRPNNSRLDCTRLEEAFGLYLPAWQRGVDHTLAEILDCGGIA
ncbi:dTDP-4-dehydrorhamnose reductase [Euhalothece natronophila Z-M001]|uniref:dTDP-4-dehydrorhamnose reductase n=1 Tax=Euhalothece natronophila Z-M001 TaxID=522448 RepID=A0A5B8NHG6_9CHRO|nr:dTDP-4-dehydrorhamnose reductase [Euhalothece natronophila]QDZ38653.1 dTDP-4-dehydrorhamnose reductase [Euhalothece natronophila Z-M001]